VDTTAAGDSFAGAYIASRLAGATAGQAAAAGNRLAARVVQHRGAILPMASMADLVAELRDASRDPSRDISRQLGCTAFPLDPPVAKPR
jgi:sugar/nucleoside kinase (ribokinase family)